MTKKFRQNQGFTLLEILLVVAAIGILASIVILALNPAKQLADTRNAQRKTDVNTILNAVYQYYIDNGTLPATITTSQTEICAGGTDDAACAAAGLVSLNVLIANETYLTDIPFDPNGTCATNGVCYEIALTENNRVTVVAPDAEQNTVISVTR